MRKHKIKLISDRQLSKLTKCDTCPNEFAYKDLYFYVDESNIAITNNSRGICKACKENSMKV